MEIITHNLQKKYNGKTVLDLLKLSINSGEVFGIIGNNGAGKTTFLKLLLDLIKADAGYITSAGTDVAKNDQWKEYTGSYLDGNFVIDYLTPEEFFIFVGTVYNMRKEVVFEKLKAFAKFFNDEILDKKKYIRQLSEGNKQKVGIAAAMLIDPKVLILDEPYAHLDPRSQMILKELIIQHSKKIKSTILISSHNLEFVTNICDRIVLLEKGVIIKDKLVHEDLLVEFESYFKVSIR
jgi:ABC-2 type transport system ATP-binding protein